MRDGQEWLPGCRVVIVANRALVETGGEDTWTLLLAMHLYTIMEQIERIHAILPNEDLHARGLQIPPGAQLQHLPPPPANRQGTSSNIGKQQA